MPASVCSLDLANLTACNVSGQRAPPPPPTARALSPATVLGSAVQAAVQAAVASAVATAPSVFASAASATDDDSGGSDGWDCSALSADCARDLQLLCGAGERCVRTSRRFTPGVFYTLVVVAVAVAVGVPTAAVTVARRRRARTLLRAQGTQRRAATVELLQQFVDDEDVGDVMLPEDSVDFGPRSPCIASGGGGSVYKCTLTLTATRLTEVVGLVACKEIHAMQDLVAVRAGAEEFAKELSALMKLRHEFIVAFYGMYQHFDVSSGAPVDRYFLVTQLADHGSLDSFIEQPFGDSDGGSDGGDGGNGDGKAQSLRRRLAWTRQIALAVHYLHREEFVHRDLEPQNVLLHGDDWHCLLTDFGLARSLSSERTLTSQIGTAQFMPPEALSGLADAPADAELPKPATLGLAKAWDVYSLGCLIAALFNRTTRPYPDLDERVVMVKVLVNDLRPDMPSVLSTWPALQELLRSMWRTDPAARPDMATVLDALDAAVAVGAGGGARAETACAGAGAAGTGPVADSV